MMKKVYDFGKMLSSGLMDLRFVLSAGEQKQHVALFASAVRSTSMDGGKKHPFALAALCLWAICLFAAPAALADPPQEIGLTYDLPSQTLTVNITHKSFAAGMHYIKQIDIQKNGAPAAANSYKSQPGKTSFSYTYQIPAAVGDTLEVTAACNLQGSKTASLKVGEPKKP